LKEIKLRIISSIPLQIDNLAANLNIDKLILHFHGGGFALFNSFSYQNVTTRWANELKGVPIFSVDYRLAPEHKFPAAIDDCY
jgi:hormone-sensitive lipase